MALAAVGAAPMNIVVRRIHHHGVEGCESLAHVDLLDRNDVVAANRQNGARHHFNCMFRGLELGRRRAGALDRLDMKPALAAPQRFAVHRHPVHGDAIKRRSVTFRINIFAQRSPDTLR